MNDTTIDVVVKSIRNETIFLKRLTTAEKNNSSNENDCDGRTKVLFQFCLTVVIRFSFINRISGSGRVRSLGFN